MPPRFAFQASKFRNVECRQLPREQSYDALQVTRAPAEGNALAAAVDRFAFAHQTDGGGAIQLKLLSDCGKSPPLPPPLIRAHQQRVNSLEFSPFDARVLASASADGTVKVWQLPASGELDADVTTPVATFTTVSHASAGAVRFHPSAQGVVAFYAHKGELLVGDVEAQALRFESVQAPSDNLCALAWSYDGSVLLTAALDKHVRLVDPRAAAHGRPALQTVAHSGRRPASVAWCGRLERFVTAGSDSVQERELKLWDPRNLATAVHRQRLDASIGQLVPLYDDDVNLLFVLGRGDRSVRSFEVDAGRGAQALDHSVLANMTFAAALLPKQACDTASCEVARVLNLSASGACDVLSFRVPRKDAARAFQSDLYPDTKAFAAALTAAEWCAGGDAAPVLEPVRPSNTASAASSVARWAAAPAPVPAASSESKLSSWGSATWTTLAGASPPAAAPVSTASTSQPPVPVAPSGWGTSSTAWGATTSPAVLKATPAAPAWKATASVPNQLPQWQTAPAPAANAWGSPPKPEDAAATLEPAEQESHDSLSDKALRLGAKYGHKFKYIAGKQATRNELFYFGDTTVASSAIASPVIKASARFWAVPITGAGGPVMVSALTATGRASSSDATWVLNGHKYAVTDMDFSPFQDDLLATGAGDAAIHVWAVGRDTRSATPSQSLKGHSKAVRSVKFHPTAAHVLCSTAQDLSVRLWDVEYGKEQVALSDKLEDMVWNMDFNDDGSLLATSSREKIVRVFDPRQPAHPLVAMGCGYDSAKPQFVAWVDASALVTVGVSARNEKQIVFWDPRNLVEPVARPVTVETTASSVVHYPLYDESSRLLFLVGLGDRHVQSFEIDAAAAAAHPNLPFAYAGQSPISGAALLPKALCDVRRVEVDRLLLLTPSVVDRVSFSLPRTDKLRAFFQDDVYGDVRAAQPALAAAQWFAGENAAPILESLRPNDMVPLSQKPKDVVQARPKTLEFQDRIRKEDEEKRRKAEQFERLNVLASQPSLHSVTKGVAAGGHQSDAATAAARESDSDDDWDD
ncbi:hypothetical protein PybrP1_008941 [[Pythium] brassicae (nom. inval.)]|nr:hypothetical protein PybrP1_008941 [[Pythium] brassicae (nom. inval.)]